MSKHTTEMLPDNIYERNNHIQHCRLKVADWSMRDVLEYLESHCASVREYPHHEPDIDTDILAAIDADNRERAARYMSGYPEFRQYC